MVAFKKFLMHYLKAIDSKSARIILTSLQILQTKGSAPFQKLYIRIKSTSDILPFKTAHPSLGS